MCPILDWTRPNNITACEEAGLKMWMYTSLEPHANYCNFRIDNGLWQARLLFWQVAQLRLSGFLYYALAGWSDLPAQTHAPIDSAALDHPYIDPAAWSPMHGNDTENVGDGILLWPGTAGPLASIRLHGVRDGVEDADYFALLRVAKGDAAVQAVIAQVSNFNNLEDHINGTAADLALMMRLRAAVAKEIVAAM